MGRRRCFQYWLNMGIKFLSLKKTKDHLQQQNINTDGEQLRVFDKLNIAEEIVANSNQIENIHFLMQI